LVPIVVVCTALARVLPHDELQPVTASAPAPNVCKKRRRSGLFASPATRGVYRAILAVLVFAKDDGFVDAKLCLLPCVVRQASLAR